MKLYKVDYLRYDDTTGKDDMQAQITKGVQKMVKQNAPQFMTIRQVAATGILSEHHLRLMAKKGELPGIYAGTRFKVNYPLLVEKLNQDSMEVKSV